MLKWNVSDKVVCLPSLHPILHLPVTKATPLPLWDVYHHSHQIDQADHNGWSPIIGHHDWFKDSYDLAQSKCGKP